MYNHASGVRLIYGGLVQYVPMTTDLRVNDPTCSYAAFKLAFHQHYGKGSLTHKLNWANSFHQRTNEQTSEYFARSSAELANHLKESSQELFGKEYVYADITDPFVHFQAAIEGEIVANMLTLDSFTRQLRAALAGANAAMKAHDFTRVKNYQKCTHFLEFPGNFSKIKQESSRTFAAEQLGKRGDEIYTKRGTMLLITDKIIEHEHANRLIRNDRLNLTSASSSSSSTAPPKVLTVTPQPPEDPSVEALQKQKKKGKGKGKGKGASANVNASNTIGGFPPTQTPRKRGGMQFLQEGGPRGGRVLH
jgi:hypothetical protein